MRTTLCILVLAAGLSANAPAAAPLARPIDAYGDPLPHAAVARLGTARAETNRRLDNVRVEAMTRPTIWSGCDVDVRFRLHRFGAHVVEHTIQCEKTLAALGWRPPEGRRIVRYIMAALGEVEELGAVTEARAIEARLAERFASVGGV